MTPPTPSTTEDAHKQELLRVFKKLGNLLVEENEEIRHVAQTCYHKRMTQFFSEINNNNTITTLSSRLKSIKDNYERVKLFNQEVGSAISGIIEAAFFNNVQSNITKFLSENAKDLPAGTKIRNYLHLHSYQFNLSKENDFSEFFRSLGNHYYQARKGDKALRCYTLACCYAPPGSKCLWLGYSNRSACFKELGMIDKAIEDINRCEEFSNKFMNDEGFQKIHDRVVDRKARCMKQLEELLKKPSQQQQSKSADESLIFKLKNPNESIPSAESFIGIKCDDKVRGRRVVNIGDKVIEPGTVIIVEEPFSRVLLRSLYFEFKHCTTCLKDLDGGGVPCETCVFHIYCSTECSANTPVSKVECAIAPCLFEIKPDRILYLALSTLLKQPVSELVKIVKEERGGPQPPQGQDTTTIQGFVNGKYESMNYHQIYNLMYHEDLVTPKELTELLTNAFVVTELIDQCVPDYFDDGEERNEQKLVFCSLLVLHQMNFPCNAHSLYKLDIQVYENKKKQETSFFHPSREQIQEAVYSEIGAGAFSLLSMINHSCDPNVTRITLRNGVNAVVAISKIPPGAEVLDNYGTHYAMSSREERIHHLQENYNFTCNCVACSENWGNIGEINRNENFSMLCCKCGGTVENWGKMMMKKNTGDDDKNAMMLLKCVSCGEKHDKGVLENLNYHLETIVHAATDLNEFKLDEAYKKAVSALKFVDGRIAKPYKSLNAAQEILKHSLFLKLKFGLFMRNGGK